MIQSTRFPWDIYEQVVGELISEGDSPTILSLGSTSRSFAISLRTGLLSSIAVPDTRFDEFLPLLVAPSSTGFACITTLIFRGMNGSMSRIFCCCQLSRVLVALPSVEILEFYGLGWGCLGHPTYRGVIKPSRPRNLKSMVLHKLLVSTQSPSCHTHDAILLSDTIDMPIISLVDAMLFTPIFEFQHLDAAIPISTVVPRVNASTVTMVYADLAYPMLIPNLPRLYNTRTLFLLEVWPYNVSQALPQVLSDRPGGELLALHIGYSLGCCHRRECSVNSSSIVSKPINRAARLPAKISVQWVYRTAHPIHLRLHAG